MIDLMPCRALASPPCVAQIERTFITMRLAPAAGQVAFESALSWVAAASCGLVPAAYRTGSAMLQAAEQLAREAPENAYHNRRHVAETMLAMGWLGALACADGTITREEAVLAVVAMAGHDFGHDGSRGQDGWLETRASAATCVFGRAAGLDSRACNVLDRLIMATRPTGRPGGDGWDAQVDPLVVLIREADIFASVLPRLGWRLGLLLRREWRLAGDPAADCVASFTGRHAFLSARRSYSAAAMTLGLPALAARQCRAFQAVADELGVVPTGEAGAAALDTMKRADGLRRYRGALAAC